MKRLFLLCAGLMLMASSSAVAQQNKARARKAVNTIAPNILIRIIRAEDERRCDESLLGLLANENARVRQRAALAAGRIGDERAVPALAELLLTDREPEVRRTAAFALGEIESPAGAYALTSVLKDSGAVARARAVEALGKIAAALASSAPPQPAQTNAPKTEDDRLDILRAAILGALRFEAGRSAPDRLAILLGLTAVLRAKPEGAGPVIAPFLNSSDPRIVADTLNTMSRLRLKDNNDAVRKLLLNHADPTVRANAARLAGAAEDKGAFDALLDRTLHDADLRVRVSAIRSLGVLKDQRAVLPLRKRGTELFRTGHPVYGDGVGRNEGLEILNTLGLILAGKPENDTGPETAAGMELYLRIRAMTHENILEDEIARARQSPAQYLEYLRGFESAADLSPPSGLRKTFYGARSISARAAGLAEIGRIKPPPPETVTSAAQSLLRRMLNDRRTPVLAIPNILTSYAVFKPKEITGLLPRYLHYSDVIIRSTAAELLGELEPGDANRATLIAALASELARTEKGEENDAALAILDALGKQKNAAANDAIKTALDSSDHLLRRKAVTLLKANGVGDFSSRIGTVKPRHTESHYRRAIARIGKQVRATVETSKGAFTIEFLPDHAPLTVDNFVQLARKGYFNGQTIPRVVANFVVQAGDPRGDQNGGPGYQIRCELNEVPFERGTVGMALSGKDTGGSQWFVTHSPQPHLDGGYTVFGRVVSGMEVVDRIARGDLIRRVTVSERP